MTSYKKIDWNSLNFARNHLYRKFANPINNALGRLAIARHVEHSDETDAQLRYVEHNLERALNLIRAWAALIHVQNGGTITDDQRRVIGPNDLPAWLTMYLDMQTGVHLDHNAPVFVHPETYFEGIMLLWQVGQAIGGLKHITSADAKQDGQSIWLRAIFDPPPTGTYTSLTALVEGLDEQKDYDTLVQLMVLGDLFAINGADLRIQNNKRSGEQALAASLPVVPDHLPEESNGDDFFTSVLNHVHDRAGEDPASQETIFSQVIKELNGQAAPPDPAGEVDDVDETETGEATLMVPPPNMTERLAALGHVPDAEAEQPHAPAESSASPDEPDTLVVPPPGFRERLAALAQPELKPVPPNGDEVEVVPSRDPSDTDIVPPPEVQRRLLERKAKHDPRPNESPQPGIEPEKSTDPNGDNSPTESVDRDL